MCEEPFELLAEVGEVARTTDEVRLFFLSQCHDGLSCFQISMGIGECEDSSHAFSLVATWRDPSQSTPPNKISVNETAPTSGKGFHSTSFKGKGIGCAREITKISSSGSSRAATTCTSYTWAFSGSAGRSISNLRCEKSSPSTMRNARKRSPAFLGPRKS